MCLLEVGLSCREMTETEEVKKGGREGRRGGSMASSSLLLLFLRKVS